MTSYGDDLRARMKAYVARLDADRGRGRPKFDRVGDLTKGMRAHVFAVLLLELSSPRKRGARTEATRAIAKKRRIKYETLKKAVQRHRKALQFWARWWWEHDEVELSRRIRGFPPDVKRLMGPLAVKDVLHWLRDEGIDGNCPEWLRQWAREHDLMSPK